MFRTKQISSVICAAMCTFTLGVIITGARAQAPAAQPVKVEKQTATLAAGCFWSMEAIFKQLKGVEKVTSGYAGGKLTNPSYEDVETGNTGHAETLNIVFDPSKISFKDLLEVLLTIRNPTTLNQQGNDVGSQYRSVIFYHNPEQRKDAIEMIKKINASHIWHDLIVTAVTPYSNFYPAEQYHVDYYHKHPDEGYCRVVIAPEIAEFRQKFRSKLKQ